MRFEVAHKGDKAGIARSRRALWIRQHAAPARTLRARPGGSGLGGPDH